MHFIGVVIAILWKILYVDNRMVPIEYVAVEPNIEEAIPPFAQSEENLNEKVIGLMASEGKERDGHGYEMGTKSIEEMTKKPCAVVVLSNIQNSNVQSLLRKYRYDANGILIPSSVKYFMKVPQGLRASPLLVPLNDKAFSPLGGFVRYYKEVPPIPQSW